MHLFQLQGFERGWPKPYALPRWCLVRGFYRLCTSCSSWKELTCVVFRANFMHQRLPVRSFSSKALLTHFQLKRTLRALASSLPIPQFPSGFLWMLVTAMDMQRQSVLVCYEYMSWEMYRWTDDIIIPVFILWKSHFCEFMSCSRCHVLSLSWLVIPFSCPDHTGILK